MPALPGRRSPLLLELDLTRLPISVDSADPLARLAARGQPQIGPVLRALHDAATDKHVVGLIAKVGGALPWAGMQELRLAVRAFAASGKPTAAWAESFSEGSADMTALVLATGFDRSGCSPEAAWGRWVSGSRRPSSGARWTGWASSPRSSSATSSRTPPTG